MAGGARCDRAGGDPVELQIGGALYPLYRGCGTTLQNQCMTSIVPDGGTFKDQTSTSGGYRLLCEAMGWRASNTLNDETRFDGGRGVAVVQTFPFVYGTATGVANTGTYIQCAP